MNCFRTGSIIFDVDLMNKKALPLCIVSISVMHYLHFSVMRYKINAYMKSIFYINKDIRKHLYMYVTINLSDTWEEDLKKWDHARTVFPAGSRPICKLCGMTFATKNSLKRHYDVHVGTRPFRCTVCSVQFNRKDNLQRHAQRFNHIQD